MKKDVFISYSSNDVNIANNICKTLEEDNISCFIACRDIQPGSDWDEAINNAIVNSKVLVLVYSESSNTSPQVKKELNLAINNNLTILQFRIDKSNPTGVIKHYLSDVHCLSASNDNGLKNIDLLKDIIRNTISHPHSKLKSSKSKMSKWFYITPLIIVLSLFCFFTVQKMLLNKEKQQVYEVYKYALNNFYINTGYDVKYTLFDIDNNGVPELIYNYADWRYQTYTFSNNNLINSGEIFAKYGIEKYGDMLLAHNGGTGYSDYCQVQLNEALKIQQYEIPFLSRASPTPINDSPTYCLNQKKISESEYMKIYNDITQLEMLPANDLSLLEILK